MLPASITLGAKTYVLTTQRPTSSIRAVAGLASGNKELLTVSHEHTKSGVVNSVIIFQSDALVVNGTVSEVETFKVQFKVSYKDFSNRAALQAGIDEAIVNLRTLLNTPATMTSFFNEES